MKRTIRRTIKTISKKNLIFPGIVLAVMILLLLLILRADIFQPERASTPEEIVALYEQGDGYVHVTADNLQYSNYDYYTSRKNRFASYYYILEEDQGPSCVFFLISGEKGQQQEVIDHFDAKARFMTKDAHFETFLEGFAKDIGWDVEALKEVSHGFVVSQFDYRPGLIMILVALILVLIAACAAYMIANLIFIWKPHLHPSCRRLKHFGLDGEDFTEIDHELAEDLLISAGQIHVTENYLIVIGKRTLWMVPLFNIVWAYKYSEWNPFVKKKKLTYSLVIVTSPKEKITIRGNKKPHTDKILQFLDSNFTHITVGYTDEIREQMEKLL